MSARSLEEILALCDEYVPGDPPEFFFDRNPENFPSVLEMYRSGKFHIPDSATCKMGLSRVQVLDDNDRASNEDSRRFRNHGEGPF